MPENWSVFVFCSGGMVRAVLNANNEPQAHEVIDWDNIDDDICPVCQCPSYKRAETCPNCTFNFLGADDTGLEAIRAMNAWDGLSMEEGGRSAPEPLAQEITNEERAIRADQVLAYYVSALGMDDHAAVTDLLADLMHLCAQPNAEDFESILTTARMHFEAEGGDAPE